MLHHHSPQGGLNVAGQPGSPRVPQRLPPGGAQLAESGERSAGRHRPGQDEAELGHGGPARRGVQGTQPPHACPDHLTEPSA